MRASCSSSIEFYQPYYCSRPDYLPEEMSTAPNERSLRSLENSNVRLNILLSKEIECHRLTQEVLNMHQQTCVAWEQACRSLIAEVDCIYLKLSEAEFRIQQLTQENERMNWFLSNVSYHRYTLKVTSVLTSCSPYPWSKPLPTVLHSLRETMETLALTGKVQYRAQGWWTTRREPHQREARALILQSPGV